MKIISLPAATRQLALLGWAWLTISAALAQKAKSIPFDYLPETGADRYNQRVPQKTLPLDAGQGFVILAHQAASSYNVERYDADLKKQWTATVPVAPGETMEAFGRSAQQAWVVLHHRDASSQHLRVVPVGLAGGQLGTAKTLLTVPARDRRPGIAFSPDGSRLLAYRYFTRDNQIRSLSATLFDSQLNKGSERTYDFQDLRGFFSPAVHLANDGTQYVTLVGDGMTKLTVRRYPASATQEVKVLGVAVGGTFQGRRVTVRDTRFLFGGTGTLYAAALCADYETGAYQSLKLVKFDFAANDLKLWPEIAFDASYLAELGTATGSPVERLDDLYLADLLLTDEQQLVVIAERHFEEEGEAAPVHARELHLFGYGQAGAPGWHTFLAKDQVAPAVDAYTGIGFRAAAFGHQVQLLTLETLNQKPDLYLRRLNAQTGVLGAPEPLKLSVAAGQPLTYVKDFTAWLGPKTLVGVSRPSKKSARLQLEKVVLE